MTTPRPTVVVTGLGATTPLGGTAEETWQAALAGRSGASALDAGWVEEYDLPVSFAAQLTTPVAEVLKKVETKRLDPFAQYALVAAREAWADAGSPEVEPERLASAVGTGIGGVQTLLTAWEALRTKGPRRVYPLSIPMLMPNSAAGTVSLEFGARAGAHTLVSACSSGAESIGYGAHLIREGLADGSVRIAVGTHALLGKGVTFADLGLLVIDEEQRFGAAQKEKLRALGQGLHVLSMSATPIPRTLQTALVGLQDLSILHTPPARRRPIRTLLADDGDATLRQALLREHRRGGQSFVVVPRVEDIAPVAERLERLLPALRLRVAHGSLSAREIDEVMVGFAGGDGDVLLATGIIESGLDVARANSMVILRPALFGLAQLHQLRGRVGRGPVQAYCHLLTAEGEDLSEDAQKRLGTLQAMDRLGAGMAISAADLDRRGSGDLLGERQAGHVQRVGLGLYQQMLAQALRRAKGLAEVPPPPQVPGEPGHIPADYVPEPENRLDLYHRIARASDAAEVARLADEIADRFGPLPEPTVTLLRAAGLRALGAVLGVETLSLGPEGVALCFRDGVDMEDRAPLALDLDGVAIEDRRLTLHHPGPEDRLDVASDLLERMA